MTPFSLNQVSTQDLKKQKKDKKEKKEKKEKKHKSEKKEKLERRSLDEEQLSKNHDLSSEQEDKMGKALKLPLRKNRNTITLGEKVKG